MFKHTVFTYFSFTRCYTKDFRATDFSPLFLDSWQLILMHKFKPMSDQNKQSCCKMKSYIRSALHFIWLVVKIKMPQVHPQATALIRNMGLLMNHQIASKYRLIPNIKPLPIRWISARLAEKTMVLADNSAYIKSINTTMSLRTRLKMA